MARILTPEQIARALLLTHGEVPRNTVRRPALLDPQSGFVLDEGARNAERETTVRTVLGHRYPAEVLDAVSPTWVDLVVYDLAPRWNTRPTGISRYLNVVTDRELLARPQKVTPTPNIPPQQIESAQRDLTRLQEWPALASEFVSNASEKERAEALRFHTRRLFTSPRLLTVLEERMRQGGLTLEEDPGTRG